ncbi:thioredoxin TrxA [Salinisphaera orenii]|uniref:Thioredoxin n=1 Tax=Salinisphaera orenii YIM 95161 TaxID=1051139 RepID=A0A423PG90_9GAMM|nr:thioredoxin TrxA [Salinisphaera halophila]ROO24585.1 thioredoxin [Salinisphaera halophila YIM 95161]
MANPVEVTDSSFEQDVLQADTPVLVDYWADWCGPCKSVAPVVDAVADEYEGRLKVAKLDIDANSETPAKFGVRGIPTLMLFNQGEAVGTQVGAVSQAKLQEFLDEHL